MSPTKRIQFKALAKATIDEGDLLLVGTSVEGETLELKLSGETARWLLGAVAASQSELRTRTKEGLAPMMQATRIDFLPSTTADEMHLVVNVMPDGRLYFAVPLSEIREDRGRAYCLRAT